MTRIAALLTVLATIGLTGCLPAPGLVADGPYRGCTVSSDGTTIDCPYANQAPERTERGTTAQPAPEPDDDTITRPLPPPSCDPICPGPEPEPEPPACKPGYGYGNPHACHDGPPGR